MLEIFVNQWIGAVTSKHTRFRPHSDQIRVVWQCGRHNWEIIVQSLNSAWIAPGHWLLAWERQLFQRSFFYPQQVCRVFLHLLLAQFPGNNVVCGTKQNNQTWRNLADRSMFVHVYMTVSVSPWHRTCHVNQHL